MESTLYLRSNVGVGGQRYATDLDQVALPLCCFGKTMKEITVEKSFCTTRQAADLLGVSVGTVQLWVENGLLKAWKTAGGHRRVMRDSVDSLLHKTPERTTSTALPRPAPDVLHVQVVEDDENLLRLYQSVLKRWPMATQLSVATDAVTGLLMIGRRPPDLLITDLSMPGMDGCAMLRILRQNADMRDTRIVVVTGLDASELAQREGIPDDIEILAKPVPFARLQAIATEIAVARSIALMPS